MRMSADGRAKLIAREGFKTVAYRDSVGVLTIGVGHTSAAGPPAVTPGLTITKAQVDEILSRDLVQYENAVNAVRVPLAQGQFDALVSFCFNIGIGGFKKSTVVKRLNKGAYRGAADALLMWNKPPEIMGRRRSERAQFLAATGTPIADAARKRIASAETAEPAEPLPMQAALADLRASGSRTIAGADQAKQGVAVVASTLTTAGALASQVQDMAGQAQSAAENLQSAAGVLMWARGHIPTLIVAALILAALWGAWRIWRGASLVTAARVDDAVSGLNIGR